MLATGGNPGVTEIDAWGYDDDRCVSSWQILSGQVEPAENVLV